MILQALYDYYQIKRDSGDIPPEGYSNKKIDFFIILDNEGKYVDIESLQVIEKNKLVGKSFQVPSIGKQVERHSNAGNDANLLWDNTEFVLGIGKKGEIKSNSFIETIGAYYPHPPNDVTAVLKFLKQLKTESTSIQKLVNHNDYGEQIESGKVIVSFRIGSAKPIIYEDHVKYALDVKKEKSEVLGTCLITGEQEVPIELTHTPTKGVIGSQTSGANLIAFNKISFTSYHKEQSFNAPVGTKAASGYIKALKYLIDSPTNKVRIADSTILFWAEKASSFINPEEVFSWVITAQKLKEEDPDKGVEAIKTLYNAIFTGQLPREKNNRFYILGLAPNAARISVRFWKSQSLEEFGYNIKKHFDDLKIVQPDWKSDYIVLNEILSSVSLVTKNVKKSNIIHYRGKAYDVTPNLAGHMVEAIIDGSLYPKTLLNLCIIRIRAEATKKDQNGKSIPNVTRTRAAILKAYLNRLYANQKINQKEIKMSLDKSNTNEGYLLGRLFAILERAQFVSNNYKEPNSGVRDRYYSSFSSSPVSVLPIIERLYGHHLKKIKNAQKFYDAKLMEENKKEIVDKLEPDKIPSNLTLQQQALFSIGYYHQKNELETFKTNTKEIV
jgi:CRISPR-associated protein Csd1